MEVQKVRGEGMTVKHRVYSFYPVIEKNRYLGTERFDYKVLEFRDFPFTPGLYRNKNYIYFFFKEDL